MELPKTKWSHWRRMKSIMRKHDAGKIDELTALGSLYKIADLHNVPIGRMLSCQEGCSYCCVAPVDLSAIEARYIAGKAGVAQLENPRHVERQSCYSRCPFLNEDNECEVYPWRPFNCRTLHAFGTPEQCNPLNNEQQVYFGSVAYGYGSSFLSAVSSNIKRLNHSETVLDIRCFFDIEQ